MRRGIIAAARVPLSLQPQAFGLWKITRHDMRAPTFQSYRNIVGAGRWTVLQRYTEATAHLDTWEIVMEDSRRELRKHLPIFERALGRVLVTGLGLGCVVRGLLSKREVTYIDVVEIDRGILRVVGAEFEGNPRVTLHHGDALKIDLGDERWDFGWHDLWIEEGEGRPHLQHLHAELFLKFSTRCAWQGAWAFPSNLARRLPWNEKAQLCTR